MARKTPAPTDRPHHWMSNDPLMNQKYEALRTFRAGIADNQRRVGVVIGTSGLLSMADALPPVVYATDISDLALEWIHRSVVTIRRERTPVRYLKAMLIEPSGRNEVEGDRKMVGSEKQSYGSYHYLSSQSRYDECRAAVGRHTFRFVSMDYSVPDQVAAFGDQLRAKGEVVDTFNATNVHNVIVSSQRPRYAEALKELPWADSYRILCSSFDLNEPAYIPPLYSLEEYGWLMEPRLQS